MFLKTAASVLGNFHALEEFGKGVKWYQWSITYVPTESTATYVGRSNSSFDPQADIICTGNEGVKIFLQSIVIGRSLKSDMPYMCHIHIADTRSIFLKLPVKFRLIRSPMWMISASVGTFAFEKNICLPQNNLHDDTKEVI